MNIIGEVFTEIQDSASISSKQIFTLLGVFESDKNQFFQGIEECFLKVIKNNLKIGKNQIAKYEKLAEKLFQNAYTHYSNPENQQQIIEELVNQQQEDEQDNNGEEQQQQKKKKGRKNKKKKEHNITREDLFSLFQYFLQFFTEGLESPQMQTKIFCGRILFFLLKTLKSEELAEMLDEEIAKFIISAVILLLRDKKASVKRLGIKISSYLQYLGIREDLQDQIAVLKYDMLKIMCTDESEDVRNDAVTNLDLNDGTFPHLVKRVRDKSIKIRQTVFQKLIKEQVLIANLPQLADIYKLVYDGLGARDPNVRQVCVRYLTQNFKMFKDDEENYRNRMDGGDDGLQKYNKKDEIVVPDKQQVYKDVKVSLLNFLSTFEIEKTLIHPHLYKIMEEMIKELIKSQVVDADNFSMYLKELLTNELNLKKNKSTNVDGSELFLLRVLCQMLQNEDEKKEVHTQIQSTIEDSFPSGLDFCHVVEHFANENNLLSLHQSLLLSELLINSDETSRDYLQKTLEKICLTNEYWEEEIPDDEVFNDVYRNVTVEKLQRQQFASAQYDTQIIRNSNDLLPIIIRIFKKLIPHIDDFSNKILSLISDVKESLEKGEDDTDLNSEQIQLDERMQKLLQKIEECEDQIKQLKKKKGNQQALYAAEKEKNDCQEHYEKLKEEYQELSEKIYNIKIKSLIISESLFMYCKVNIDEPMVGNLLKTFIVPLIDDENDQLKAHSAKSIALFVLTDKKLCESYSTIYCSMLQLYEGQEDNNESLHWHLVALKAVTDFVLLYDFTESSELDIGELANSFIRIAFKGDTYIKTLAVESLSKLLLMNKLPSPTQYLACLIIMWFDPSIVQKGEFKIMQILSAFFKKFISMKNMKNLEIYEQAVEIVLLILVQLKGSVDLNQDYFGESIRETDFIMKLLTLMKNQLSYEENQDIYKGAEEDNLNENNININSDLSRVLGVCPIERLYIFLCKKAANGCQVFQHFLSTLVITFDFINFAELEKLLIVQKFFNPANEQIERNEKEMHKFDKTLIEKISAFNEDESQPEYDDQYIESKVEKINQSIAQTTTEASELVKNLVESLLIVSSKTQQKANLQSSAGDDLFQPIKAKQQQQIKAAPTKKNNQKTKKAKQSALDEEIDEESQETEQKRDVINEAQESQESNDEEEEEVETKKPVKKQAQTKKNSKKHAKKQGKKPQQQQKIIEEQSEEDDNNDEEEQQSDAEQQESNQTESKEEKDDDQTPVRRTRSQKTTPNTKDNNNKIVQKKQPKKQPVVEKKNNKRKKQIQSTEELDSNQEEEEEEQENNSENEEEESEEEEEEEEEKEEEKTGGRQLRTRNQQKKTEVVVAKNNKKNNKKIKRK